MGRASDTRWHITPWNVFVNRRPALLPGWRSMRCASCGKRWNVHDNVRGLAFACTCGVHASPLSLGQALAVALSQRAPAAGLR